MKNFWQKNSDTPGRYGAQKEEMVYWARLLNERGLVTARNGNLSAKAGDGVLITAHDSYLGQLSPKDIMVLDDQGMLKEGEGEPSSETPLHLGVYNAFKEAQAVVHAHAPYTTAFFHYFERLEHFSYEAQFYLANLVVVPQATPKVTDVKAIIDALHNSSVVVLGHHGVVAMGRDMKEAFGLTELLEEQVRVNFMAQGLKLKPLVASQAPAPAKSPAPATLKMFSPEHIKILQDLVNNDAGVCALGEQLRMTCTLAVASDDSEEGVKFYYEKGRIVKTDTSREADFVISASREILKKVFNRELDPFAASTQGKIKIKGDFNRLTSWYPVMTKTFAIWAKAAVV